MAILTSLFKLAQKLLLIYLLLPWSTTSLPNRVSSPSTLLSTATFLPSLSDPFGQLASSPPDPFGQAPAFFSLSASCSSCSSTCAFKLCTTPSKRLRRSMSSPSAGFLILRGARPGPGKMHSIFARAQLEHGCFLSHFTLRLRQVTQERGFRPEAPAPEEPLKLPPLWGFVTRSLAPAWAVCSTSSLMVGVVWWSDAQYRGIQRYNTPLRSSLALVESGPVVHALCGSWPVRGISDGPWRVNKENRGLSIEGPPADCLGRVIFSNSLASHRTVPRMDERRKSARGRNGRRMV